MDFVIQMVMQKPQRNKGITAAVRSTFTSLTNSVMSYGKKKDTFALETANQIKLKEQPGKRTFDWKDISCSCACGDTLMLGFGNGAFMCLNTRNDIALADSIMYKNLNFTDLGDSSNFDTSSDQSKFDAPLDKMRMIYLDKA